MVKFYFKSIILFWWLLNWHIKGCFFSFQYILINWQDICHLQHIRVVSLYFLRNSPWKVSSLSWETPALVLGETTALWWFFDSYYCSLAPAPFPIPWSDFLDFCRFDWDYSTRESWSTGHQMRRSIALLIPIQCRSDEIRPCYVLVLPFLRFFLILTKMKLILISEYAIEWYL